MVWLDKALNSSSVCGIICWIDIESGYVLNVSGVASINLLEAQCKQAEPGSHVSWATTQERILLKWLLRSRVSLSRILSYLKRLLGKVFYLNGGSFCHYPPCPKPKKCSAIHYRAYIYNRFQAKWNRNNVIWARSRFLRDEMVPVAFLILLRF